ncbi:MAG: hypothetical protein GH145_02150, partial [Firmicutes bacterium]|nr:hypothetical protein [Bacillota bacterium]
KANYPLEFMAALLTSERENTDKLILYTNECRRMVIEVLPPDINQSSAKFIVAGDKIRFGLTAVKNVGEAAISSVLKVREKEAKFSSIFDFCTRVDLRTVNKRIIESLVKCGAFDSLVGNRSQLMKQQRRPHRFRPIGKEGSCHSLGRWRKEESH